MKKDEQQLAELMKQRIDAENALTSFNSQAKAADLQVRQLWSQITDHEITLAELKKQEILSQVQAEEYRQRSAIRQAELEVKNKIEHDKINYREEQITEREKEFSSVINGLRKREEDIVQKEKNFEMGMETVKKMMVDTHADVTKLTEREEKLNDREKEMNEYELALAQREKVLNSKEAGLASLSHTIQKTNADFDDRFQKNIEREKLILQRELTNGEKEKRLQEIEIKLNKDSLFST
jgi:uncharacterized protein (DUF3084 family)